MKCGQEVVEKVTRDPRYDLQIVRTFDIAIFKEFFQIYVLGVALH